MDDFNWDTGTLDDALSSGAFGSQYDFGDLSGLDFGALGQAASAPETQYAPQDTYTPPDVSYESAYDPGTGDPGANGVEYGQQGTDQPVSPLAAAASSRSSSPPRPSQPASQASTGSKLANAFGMKTGSDGEIDWADPKTMSTLIKALGAGGSFLNSIMSKGRAANSQTAQQLSTQQQANPYNQWNPVQAMRANQLFSQQYVPTQQRPAFAPTVSPIVPSRGYAEGGDVEMPEEMGALGQAAQEAPREGLVRTDTSGQADDVPVNLSGGEYIFAADVVSALGDGNNEAGAKILDNWVQSIRERARSTDPAENPPEAQHPDEYLGDE